MDVWHASVICSRTDCSFLCDFHIILQKMAESESADNIKRMSLENAWVVLLKSRVHYTLLK